MTVTAGAPKVHAQRTKENLDTAIHGAERASLSRAGVEPWPGGERELFLRVVPSRITGRRIRRVDRPASG
ncbi:hypothetical protein [Actinoallomurus sp. NPDC052274]|uniref:hypothetical protein n=1 Tax=Actinoallomurus sp. NPDC052274 TaxID=3155420 RepID=UPI00342DB777